MTSEQAKTTLKGYSFLSSITADVWAPDKSRPAYDCWYFDAMSDDGRDVLIVAFYDNFIFSPRFNQFAQSYGKNGAQNAEKGLFPAVDFSYYRDGRRVCRTVSEYDGSLFVAEREKPGCRIGNNHFELQTAPYGSGFLLELDVPIGRGKHARGSFEWLSVESGFTEDKLYRSDAANSWNLAAARSDVTGKLLIGKGQDTSEFTFRGTGYHDHSASRIWSPGATRNWNRGRVHFADATAVFYNLESLDGADSFSKLFLVTDGEIMALDTNVEDQRVGRDMFGFRYPKRLRITTPEGIKLRVRQDAVLDSFCVCSRFVTDSTLILRDGVPRRGMGLSEFVAPTRLRFRWLEWMMRKRIRRPS